ncbi:MAG TPA: AraC family transcriptional regulator [Solimonas sp.]|nr:AraC family transcriptional regulator [Solimonas sp.]
MSLDVLSRPTVPLAYGLLTIELAAERGVARERMLEGLGLAPAALARPDTRLTLLQWGLLIQRSLQLTGDPGLAYEFGLRASLTAHGLVSYGAMSNPTGREALQFATRFVPICTLAFGMELRTEGEQAVVEVQGRIPFGPVRQYAIEMYLLCWVNALRQFWPKAAEQIELWFEWPEPEYYARYRERLPRCRFGMGVNQLRTPASLLERNIHTGNAVTAQMITGQCERELSLLGGDGDFLDRVRALLNQDSGRYPNLDTTAGRLFTSARTLKRRLREHGVSFQQLLDESRHRDSTRLLQNRALSVEEVSARVGYSSPANFSRAFRKWTGLTPGAFRDHRFPREATTAALN